MIYTAKPLFQTNIFKVKYQEIFKKPKILKDNINSFFKNENKRFMVYTGGRGGGKSTSILLSILEQHRKEEFKNMVDKRIGLFLYNNRQKIINNFEKLLNEEQNNYIKNIT